MKIRWFKRSGVFFLPAHVIGWLIFIAALAFAVYAFIDINNQGHSVSDILMNFVFILLIEGAVYTLIAFFTSNREPK